MQTRELVLEAQKAFATDVGKRGILHGFSDTRSAGP